MINMSKIQVLKKGSKQHDYTIRFTIFDPKKNFVSTPEAKDACRRFLHCSKKKMVDEYDGFYGVWMKVGRGKNAHIEFNKTTKQAANVIFIIPKKHRRDAYKIIGNIDLPWSSEFIKRSFTK